MPSVRPTLFQGPAHRPAPRPLGLTLAAWALASFAVTLLVAGVIVRSCARSNPGETPPTPAPEDAASSSVPSPFAAMVFPTTLDLLTPAAPSTVFMPTATGNPESALFGSVRTGTDGRARFHAGVDVAPAQRDRQGRPTDSVVAIADGRIAYVNRVGGDSSYGVYVVLIHDDPVGPVYSLYAHLASVPRALHVGTAVPAGTPLGIMGNSASTGIPLSRAHLHLEIGVLLSERFGAWSRANRITPDRGNYHGWNLFAVNPLDVYARRGCDTRFTFSAYLESVPAAFELVLSPPRLPEYFARYPTLWHGQTTHRGPLVLRVSEGGVILSGRPASEAELASFQSLRKPIVQCVDESALGRNGMRLIAKSNGCWTLGRAAARWLEVLTY